MKTKRISSKFELKDCKELDHSDCGHPDVYSAATHTPTPWKVEKRATYDLMNDREGYTLQINSNDGARVALLGNGKEANAAFIVRAVNAHEDLLAAVSYVSHLSEFREGGKYAGAGTAFREIIAKAEAK